MRREPAGFRTGIGEVVRVLDPLGFPYEFFHDVEHVPRLTWNYELYGAGAIVRLDHFNLVYPDVVAGAAYLEDLGFRRTEDIRDEEGVVYAAWLARKDTQSHHVQVIDTVEDHQIHSHHSADPHGPASAVGVAGRPTSTRFSPHHTTWPSAGKVVRRRTGVPAQSDFADPWKVIR
jgi:hypothetical protein